MVHQGVRLTLGLDELLPSHEWHIGRHDITEYGALGVANGYGKVFVLVNGKAVLQVLLHENDHGEAVLDVAATVSFPQELDGNIPHFEIPLEQVGLVGHRLIGSRRGDA